MSEFNLSDLEKINKSQDVMDYLVQNGIIKEKTFKAQLAYEKRLSQLQYDMLRLQSYIAEKGLKMLVIMEGRDAAGKGGTIERCIASMNPKLYHVVSLPKPTDAEKGQWYFQRYIAHLPNAGEIVFFDRSYYNRAVVEPVFEFCTASQYKSFMQQVIPLEQIWQQDGLLLFKIFLNIDKEVQAARLEDRRKDPMKQFKIGVLDQQAQEKWEVYSKFIAKMLKKTASKTTPWYVFNANDKMSTRLNVMEAILSNVPGFEYKWKEKKLFEKYTGK